MVPETQYLCVRPISASLRIKLLFPARTARHMLGRGRVLSAGAFLPTLTAADLDPYTYQSLNQVRSIDRRRC